MSSLPPRRGDYGFDAPYAPLLMALGGACLLALCVWRLWQGPGVAVTPYRISVSVKRFVSCYLDLSSNRSRPQTELSVQRLRSRGYGSSTLDPHTALEHRSARRPSRHPDAGCLP